MAHEPAAFRQHPMWRSAAIFSFGAGAVIAGTWLWRLFSGGLAADMAVEPLAAWTRLIAELLTAAAMFAAGYGLLTNARWVRKFYLVATGMLIFAGLNGLGHYLHRGEPGTVILYLLVGVAAVVFVLRVEE